MKLKPCPFCGNKDIEFVPVRGAGAPERVEQAYCHPCNIALPLRVWNTRTPDPADVLKEVKMEILNIYSGLTGEYQEGLNDGLDRVVKIIDAKIKELE